MKVLVLALLMTACVADDSPPPEELDAQTSDESPCCAYDDDGARECLLEQPDRPSSGTCGVLLCRRDDGIAHINFCVP